MEAVAINAELAELVGIEAQKIFNLAFLIGSALAGLAGALVLVDRGIDPFAGTIPITMAFIAVIVGGVESILGGAIAGFILGITINLCAIVIPSQFQHLAAFSLVILLLIVRPEGLLGRTSR
jgi:branched-chain amino acid transport system permease protein